MHVVPTLALYQCPGKERFTYNKTLRLARCLVWADMLWSSRRSLLDHVGLVMFRHLNRQEDSVQGISWP